MTKLGEDVRMGDDKCPYCNKHLDMATAVGGDYKPAPKDISVCIGCAGVMRYADDMALEKFPDILLDTLEEELRLQVAQAVIAIKAINIKINHENTNSKA